MNSTARTGAVVFAAVVALAATGYFFVWHPQGGAGTADPGNIKQVRLGAAVYRANCASCHGANLEGQPNWRSPLPTGGLPAPPHDATGHTWHHPDQLLFDYTKLGGQALMPPGVKSNMPGFGDRLSDGEIWAVLAFIKSKWPENIQRRHAALNQVNK